jgi:hypothetical protein
LGTEVHAQRSLAFDTRQYAGSIAWFVSKRALLNSEEVDVSALTAGKAMVVISSGRGLVGTRTIHIRAVRTAVPSA